MPLNDKLFLLRDVTIVISLFEIAYRRFVQKRIAMQSAHTSLKSNVSDLNDDNGSLMQLAVDSLSRVELDRSEFSMLKAVVFLHAECFGLSKTSYQQLIKWRQTVLDSLFEYMSSNIFRHGRQGPVRYGNLLSISWTLFRLAQDMKDKLLQKDDLQQLSEEIISSQLPQRLVRC
ncbi:hypothetical protein AB6A40_009221 [Gnathostoma spinigerum]|uniref:NR LBD domain-containing protein n=1 Tax=Gnathostoma spinigerum TaxID=75299 RepID=A0ABD6ETR0_9BILA